jgi:hypothetical protein
VSACSQEQNDQQRHQKLLHSENLLGNIAELFIILKPAFKRDVVNC